jgi:hypothetical protein
VVPARGENIKRVWGEEENGETMDCKYSQITSTVELPLSGFIGTVS